MECVSLCEHARSSPMDNVVLELTEKELNTSLAQSFLTRSEVDKKYRQRGLESLLSMGALARQS
eukprot:6485082-Karenia_brevis.AAC.1